MSLKDEFFASAGELRVKEYPIPGTDSILYVRELGADEWLDVRVRSWRHRQANNGEPDLLYDARVMSHSVTDKDKKLVFDPHDDEALVKLSKQPARVFDPLMRLVNEVNANGDEQHETLKKSSESAKTSNSSTGSPTDTAT